MIEFRVRNISSIIDTIIPFFKENQLDGLKKLDFEDFCKIALLIKNKEHLTENGLKQIRDINSNMNQRRSVN
jgi:hypothetical protein